MDGSTIVSQAVGNINDNVVTPVALNRWTWDLTVHSQALTVGAIKVAGGVGEC